MNWLKRNTDQQFLHLHLAKLREERCKALLPVSFADTVSNNVPRDHITTNTPITVSIATNAPVSSISPIVLTMPSAPITATLITPSMPMSPLSSIMPITPPTPITPIMTSTLIAPFTSSTLTTPITSLTPPSVTPFTPTLTYESSSLLSQNLLTPHQEAQRIMRTLVSCPAVFSLPAKQTPQSINIIKPMLSSPDCTNSSEDDSFDDRDISDAGFQLVKKSRSHSKLHRDSLDETLGPNRFDVLAVEDLPDAAIESPIGSSDDHARFSSSNESDKIDSDVAKSKFLKQRRQYKKKMIHKNIVNCKKCGSSECNPSCDSHLDKKRTSVVPPPLKAFSDAQLRGIIEPNTSSSSPKVDINTKESPFFYQRHSC